MTGHQNRDRITAVGKSYGPRAVAIADALRELAVTPRFPVGNFTKLAPHALLERGARRAQRQIELTPRSREVFAQLPRRRSQGLDTRIMPPAGGGFRRVARLHIE